MHKWQVWHIRKKMSYLCLMLEEKAEFTGMYESKQANLVLVALECFHLRASIFLRN